MEFSFDDDRRNEFKILLLNLAEDQYLLSSGVVRENFYKRFERLYCMSDMEDHLRHYYSDIFTVLTAIKNGSQKGNINVLGQNMKTLYEEYEASRGCDISKELMKLYDHVSLDIARILYSDAGDYRISGQQTVQELQGKVTELVTDVQTASAAQKRVEHELSNQQREYVTILGIFAAVVLAFTGGLAFSSSVLNNIDKVSTGKLMMIALTIGEVLLSLFFGLFHYLEKFVNISGAENNIKPLWGYMFVIAVLMVCALCLCYCRVFDSPVNEVTLNVKIE